MCALVDDLKAHHTAGGDCTSPLLAKFLQDCRGVSLSDFFFSFIKLDNYSLVLPSQG